MPGKTRPDEITGVYLAEDGIDVVSLRPGTRRESDVWLRTKRADVPVQATDMYPAESEFTEWVSPERIGPEKLEYLGEDDVWHPLTEAFKKEVLADAPTIPYARDLLSRSVADQEAFAGWLVDLPGEGIAKFENYGKVQAASRQATRGVREGRYLVTETPQGFIAGPGGLELGARKAQGFDTAALKAEDKQLTGLIKRKQASLERTTEPQMHDRLTTELNGLKARQQVVKGALEQTAKEGPKIGEMNVVAATQDFLTRKDLYAARDEYNRLVQEVESTFEAGLTEAHKVARQKLGFMVSELGRDGVIPDELVQKTIEKGAKPGDAVAKALESEAQQAARDITLAPDEMAFFASNGYKPVVTGEDVLQLDEIDTIAQVFGVGEYTKRANFFDTLGLSPRVGQEKNVFAIKVAHERSELGNVLEKNALPINGKTALTRIHEYMRAYNREGVSWGPFLKKMEGHPVLPFVDPRQLTPEDLLKIFDDVPGFTEDHAGQIMGALKRGASLGAEVKFHAPIVSARSLGHSMRVSGLPGFAEYMRTLKLPVTPRALSTTAGAAAGAATGSIIGDSPADIVTGGVIGAAAGMGYAQLAKRSYGYLPDSLARANLALRYTFSATFDMGRYTEAGMIAAAKYGLPVTFMPKRKLRQLPEGMKTPYSEGRLVKGDELWDHAMKYQDELNGTIYFHGLEDTERRVFQAGMLGFKPRDFEAYYGMELYQRGWSAEKIRDAVANINRYGVGRTAAEKTANFVFFPFSFSKKLITSLGDFILQAPGRNLLLTEGMRRYHQSSWDEKFHDFIENHAPILKQLSQVNNLVYGLSPGRFFLEGLTDHRSAAGWAGQILASVLVPGGAATSFAAATGQAGDLALNAFIPVVITGESLDKSGGVDGLGDILRRYIPLIQGDRPILHAEHAGWTGRRSGRGAVHRAHLADERDSLRAAHRLPRRDPPVQRRPPAARAGVRLCLRRRADGLRRGRRHRRAVRQAAERPPAQVPAGLGDDRRDRQHRRHQRSGDERPRESGGRGSSLLVGGSDPAHPATGPVHEDVEQRDRAAGGSRERDARIEDPRDGEVTCERPAVPRALPTVLRAGIWTDPVHRGLGQHAASVERILRVVGLAVDPDPAGHHAG